MIIFHHTMQLFKFLLGIAMILFGIIKCAPLTSNTISPSTDIKILPGSIKIAEGVWVTNITFRGTEDDYNGHQFPAQTKHCSESRYENRVSEASPSVHDCRVLHNNIAGSGKWYVTD
jgi:hypothetical protein